MKLIYLLVAASLTILSEYVVAQQSQIDAFINNSSTPSYDCPSDELAEQVNHYIVSDTLSAEQRFALTAMQTHGQICNGNNATAEQNLLTIIQLPNVNRDSRYFALAVYQLGFIYDVQSDPKRCDYYQHAQSLAEDNHSDVHLSATLGLLTECEPNTTQGIKLGKLFTLLEQYSATNEPGVVAHIHNNIGLMFAGLGQHVLAAEQYHKAHRIGLETYQGSNQLSILISAITSYMASGDFKQAKLAIDEFDAINRNVNTPLSNFWQLFAEAGYYYRTDQFSLLRQSLAEWNAMKSQVNSVTYTNLFRWYAAVLCLAEADAECLQEFLQREAQTSDKYKAYIGTNKDYLKFITDVHFFLGNSKQAQRAYEEFVAKVFVDNEADQNSAKIMGVANLYTQINNLESRLMQAKQKRERLIVFGSSVAVLSFSVLAFFLRKRRLEREAIDPITKLFNNNTALRRIEKIAVPCAGRTNALAIFDIRNFKEVNRLVGSTKADFVLQKIAETLQDITRSSDILGRFAPEQFILCLHNIEEEAAKQLFERIRQALEATTLTDDTNQQISVRSSMSIYICTENFKDLDDILDDMLRSLSIQREDSIA